MVLVLEHFCTTSVPTSSCFRVASVLASYGSRNMKSRSQSRNPRRHAAPHYEAAATHKVLSAFHRSQTANHAQPFVHHSSPAPRQSPSQSLAKHNRKPIQLIENKQQQLKSIARFCHVFNGYTANFQPPRTRHRKPLIATHQSLITPHDSRASQTTTHGIIMLSNAQRASLRKGPAARSGRRRPARQETGFALRSSNLQH